MDSTPAVGCLPVCWKQQHSTAFAGFEEPGFAGIVDSSFLFDHLEQTPPFAAEKTVALV